MSAIAQQYRKYATVLLEMAEETTCPEERQVLSEMAASCLEKAGCVLNAGKPSIPRQVTQAEAAELERQAS